MLKEVRIRAGLGDPPTTYTTNANESVNSLLKAKVDYKASELHIFCQKLEELVDAQSNNIERAFTIQNGPYTVAPLYSDLRNTPKDWFKLSTSAKQAYLKKIQSVEVRVPQSISNEPFDLPSVENVPPLSISFSETGLTEHLFKSMWEKASLLYYHKLISDIPGCVNGKMVASVSSPDKPHNVTVLKSGKFTCGCLNYKSKNLCAHEIAVVCTLVDWYKQSGQGLNAWKLARRSGLPKIPGHTSTQKKHSKSRQLCLKGHLI
jgi:hypothetical protein